MNDPNEDRVSRRRFLRTLSAAGLAGASGTLLVACGGSDDSSGGSSASGPKSTGSATPAETCSELSSLSDEEKQRRQQMVSSLEYVEDSPNPDKNCANCQLYLQSEYGEGCGGCTLFPGPVNANGYCNSWAEA